jgi:ADP-heptose:LPS heptosyltransferase
MRAKALERALKAAAYAAARVALPEPDPDPGECRLETLRRVLVVRQDRRLGNLVLLTPLLAGIRSRAPAARITVVAPKAFAAVLRPHPAVDEVIAIDHRRLLRRPLAIAQLERRLRLAAAELAIDATPHHSASFLNGLLTWASGAPFRLGYDRSEARTFLNLLVPPPAAPAHESVLLHHLLSAVTPALMPPSPPAICVPRRALAIARRACRRHGLDRERRVVGIHPGGRRGKRWEIARFEAVAAALERRGAAVVVFTGPAERPLLAAMAPPGPSRIYAPPVDVAGLRGFLAGLDAFVSGDSGPMHLAAALGVPCVSVFRVADQVRYAPLGPQHRVLSDPQGELAPEAVAAAVAEVLAEGVAPRRQLSRMTVAPHR